MDKLSRFGFLMGTITDFDLFVCVHFSKQKCMMQAFKEGELHCACEISIFLSMHTKNSELLEKPHPAAKNLYPFPLRRAKQHFHISWIFFSPLT